MKTAPKSKSKAKSAARPRAAQPPPSALPAPRVAHQKTTLSNGVRILSEQVPAAQSFAMGVWIDAGSRDETAPALGAAHFLEHIVFRATRRRTAKQIANYLESVGGYLNAFTTKDHTCYYARALSPHCKRAFDLLSDIAIYPAFRPADIELERGVILEEIKSLEDEPEELINDYLDASLFGSHPFAEPISGTERTVSALTGDDLAAFHRAFYTAENAVVAVAGNIPHDEVCRMAERFFGALPPAKARAPRPAPERGAVKHLEKTAQTQQAHFLAGAALPELSDADYYALAALNIILGDGMSSRLNQSVRERRGLCYNVYSSVNDLKDCAIASVYAAVEPQNLAKTEHLIRKHLSAIAEEPVAKQELSRAKEQLKSSLIIGLESLSGRMNLLAKSELYLGRFEEVEEKVAAIEAICADHILNFARKALKPDDWHTVVITPEE